MEKKRQNETSLRRTLKIKYTKKKKCVLIERANKKSNHNIHTTSSECVHVKQVATTKTTTTTNLKSIETEWERNAYESQRAKIHRKWNRLNDFYQLWCRHCQRLHPKYETNEPKMKRIAFNFFLLLW